MGKFLGFPLFTLHCFGQKNALIFLNQNPKPGVRASIRASKVAGARPELVDG